MQNEPQQQSTEPLVVLIDAFLPDAMAEKICSLSPRIELAHGISKAAMERAQVIYSDKFDFDPGEAPLLRWAQLNRVAIDQLLDKPIASSRIPVANVRGAYAISVAELAMAMVLALMRHLKSVIELQLQCHWPADNSFLKGENCYGKRLGIIGYGTIGRHVARIAEAMGMHVLAYKNHPEKRQDSSFCFPNFGDPGGRIPQEWFGPDQLESMLQQVDMAILTLPLTHYTKGLIDRRMLEALPSHAYLVNVGRGGVIDEPALIACLEKGRLAGAALDVFAIEPLPADSPLRDLPNLLIIPHLGSYTKDQSALAAEVFLENISRDLSNQPLINLVNMKECY